MASSSLPEFSLERVVFYGKKGEESHTQKGIFYGFRYCDSEKKFFWLSGGALRSTHLLDEDRSFIVVKNNSATLYKIAEITPEIAIIDRYAHKNGTKGSLLAKEYYSIKK